MPTIRCIALCAALLAAGPAPAETSSPDPRLETALSLALMLQSARSVIGGYQELINDPARGDKGLTGERVLEEAVAAYVSATGEDPRTVDPAAPRGALLRAQMDAIAAVIDEHQGTLNREGMGFKGFVPAVFARLVNERFRDEAGDLAEVKVTAPADLVRNRKSLPDAWESSVIGSRLASPSWPKGDVFHEDAEAGGRAAYRVLVPEYYAEGCLACHGGPAGAIDVTGYPKEGGALGDLGGVMSITLFAEE